MSVGGMFPLVDVSADESKSAAEVYMACTESGFFYVTGHGISEQLLTEVFNQFRAAFALPEEEKQKLLADENNRGYTPFAEETLDPEHQSRGDTKEGFYFGSSSGGSRSSDGQHQQQRPASTAEAGGKRQDTSASSAVQDAATHCQ